MAKLPVVFLGRLVFGGTTPGSSVPHLEVPTHPPHPLPAPGGVLKGGEASLGLTMPNKGIKMRLPVFVPKRNLFI